MVLDNMFLTGCTDVQTPTDVTLFIVATESDIDTLW